jgi:hypothetical protein
MVTKQEPLRDQVSNWLEDGQGREEIIASLVARGQDERFAREFVAEAVKLRDAKRRAQGLALILGGGCICFLSFILTITSSFTQGSFPYVLYGLTSVGIVVVFSGFMKVF